MKSKRIYFLLIVFTLVISAIAQINNKQNFSNGNLNIKITSSKDSYSIGELVHFSLQIANISNSEVFLKGIDVESHYAKIFISKNKTAYQEYKSPKPVIKSKGTFLRSGEIAQSTSTILYNIKPKTVGLSYDAAKEVSNGKILTDYAFPEAGEYYIKAVLYIPNKEGNKQIESEPVKITIEEPQGEDLEVWNKIKDSGDFAYFIQEGDMRILPYKPEERAKFQEEVEDILNKYSNSFYASSLRQSLDKFRASEAKRLEFQEKMKAKP